MSSVLRTLRALTDEARIRILRLLQKEELSVAELQEILAMGQSRISMQLTQLKQADLIELRRVGQKNYYHLSPSAVANPLLRNVVAQAAQEMDEGRLDQAGLQIVLEKRKNKLREYFDELAGKFGKQYVPGRSWKSLTEMFLRLLPPMEIADLGCGEGTLSLMLTQRAKHVFAIDASPNMIHLVDALAKRNETQNLTAKVGDLEELPLEPASVDMALLHQSLHHAIHPPKAIEEAARILRPGGQLVIMDLLKHGFDQARSLYADTWLGFSLAELNEMLDAAQLSITTLSVVDREQDSPNFETVLAIATKD